MKLKFFTIPILNPETAETELNSFCDQHRIVNVEKHLIDDAGNSCWAVCVTWLTQKGELPKTQATSLQAKKPKVDYKQILNEPDFKCFAELRDLRASAARQEGIALYSIFTNEQLAQIVQQRIVSKTALLALNGVGQTRVDKYAEPFLQHVQRWVSDETSVHQS